MLPIAPRRGWQEADAPRKVFAVLCGLLPIAWLASLDDLDHAAGTATVAIMTALVCFGGPPACYSAARVLRPHPHGTGMERKVRHWFAAIATAYGGSLLTWLSGIERGIPTFGYGTGWLYIVAASVFGPASLVWGLLTFAQRARARRG